MARSRQNQTTSCIVKDARRGHILARVFYYDSAGQRREFRKRALSRTEAKEIIRDFELELRTNGLAAVEGKERTFAEAAREYARVELVPAVIRDGHKVAGKKSIVWLRSVLENTLVPYFGDRAVQEITRPDIEEFRRHRFDVPVLRRGQKTPGKPRTIRTVNYELAVLRQVMYFAESKRWLTAPARDLFRKMISPANETKRSRLLGEDEERRLIEACSGPRAHLRPLVIAALDTTLRRGSLFRLTWSDVNFDEKIIKVKKSSTKTETAVTVGITRRLETELLDLYEHSDRRPETLVFGLGDIKRGWRSACRVAEIEGLRFHDLRAGGATSMVQAGIPPAIVRKVTGHADPAVLLDHYIRADVVAARQIAEALDRARAEREPPVPTSPLIN